MTLMIAALLGGLAALYFGATNLVAGGVNIASRTRISPLVIGLTLIAFATSAPEMVVSVSAALDGMGDLSVGNILGSNICNILLILGLSAAVCPLTVSSRIIRQDTPIMILCTLGFCAWLWSAGGFGRFGGVIFFCIFLVYTVWSIVNARRQEPKEEICKAECEAFTQAPKQRPLWMAVLQASGGLALLIVGGKALVWSSVGVGTAFGVSEAVIGLTVVAVGTSLPELATSVVAALHGQRDIAVGNVIGSNIFNILAIMGLTGMIEPVKVAGIDHVTYAMMIGSALLILPLMRTGFEISRREGFFLLAVYAGYTFWLIHSAL